MVYSIKTIKPAGGGDFTTLATWESWAITDAATSGHGDYWAECYDGGDMGDIQMNSTWDTYTSPTQYPRIYTNKDQRHDGTITSGGAYLYGTPNFDCKYFRIEGIKIIKDAVDPINIRTVSYAHIDSCLFIIDRFTNDSTFIMFSPYQPVSGVIFSNNIIYVSTTGYAFSHVIDIVASNDSDITEIFLYNNTIYRGDVAAGITFSATGVKTTPILNVTLYNNIVYGIPLTGASYYKFSGIINFTADYNCGSDGTATSVLGGTHNLDNQTATDLFVNPTSDVTLLETSPCKNAGTTIGSFNWDALHISSDNWRPQGSAWDMGALELYQAPTTNIKAVLGVTYNSLNKISGVSKALISKINGLA